MIKQTTTLMTWLAILSLLFFLAGCFKANTKKISSEPALTWPSPPSTPRIRFINSISTPDDLGIKRGTVTKFIDYLIGRAKPSIVSPYGVETDDQNRLFVVDSFQKLVHVFDVDKNEYYYFPTKSRTFKRPIDIAIDDKRGRIYVTDSKAGIVKIFTKNGKKYYNEIGSGVMQRPTGIAVNTKTDELLVLDTKSGKILRYDLNYHHLKGTFGKNGVKDSEFNYPTNIFAGRDGLIYVSDSLNFRIQVFSQDGKFLKQFGRPGDAPGYFARPRGVAADSNGNIYVVDALFDNIQIFNKKGRLLMAFGGPGKRSGAFWLPTGIYIDNSDRIYVSDSYNNRVQIFQYLTGGEK